MALIVEDGTGLTNANVMATVAEFDEYYTNRNDSEALALSTTEKEAYLIQGADYLNIYYQWANDKLNPSQAMPFPRTVFDIPNAIKAANIVLARKAIQGALFEDEERRVLKEKVSTLEVTYDQNDTQVGRVFTEVDYLVKPYLLSDTNSEIFHGVIRT